MQLRQLTFLRFVAALGVVVFHYGIHVPTLAWGLPLWRFANTAVSFFFFLSGFILTHVYAERRLPRRVDFYVARAARILPLYALALLAAAIFHAHRGNLTWDAFALNALVIQAWVPGYSQTLNSPGWSLSVEVFFYLSFPLSLPLIARQRSSARLLGLLFGSWIANLVLHFALVEASRADSRFTPLDDFSVYHPLPHLGTFVAGMCAARLFVVARPVVERWSTALLLGALAGFSSLALLPEAVLRYHHNGLFVPLYVLLVLGLASARNHLIARALSWRPLEFLGEISYGLYILQEPAAWFFFALLGASGLDLSPDQRFWLLCLWLISSSVICHLAVEVPMRSVINRGYQLLRPATVRRLAVTERRLARAPARADRAPS